MITLNSLDTAHTMSIASLGLTGRGRVRRRERGAARVRVASSDARKLCLKGLS